MSYRRIMAAGQRCLAAVLLLGVGSVHAFTEPSCPSGQGHQWTITSSPASGVACTYQQTFNGLSAMQTACTPAHGVDAGGSQHYGGSVVEPYDLGGGTNINVRTDLHFSSHSVSNGTYTMFTAQHSCVVPTCELVEGTTVEVDYQFGLGNGGAICVNNCTAHVFTGLSVGVDAETTQTITWATTNGEFCSGGNVQNLIERQRTCVSFDDGTQICGYMDAPEQISDGQVDGPPVAESATTTDVLNDDQDGCSILPSGAAFCVIGAPGTPDNGTPGINANPTATVTGSNGYANNQTLNYYNSSVVNNSTNQGTGGDPLAPGNCGAPGQPACATKGNCGGPGQPACQMDLDCGGPNEPLCEVQVDETGVETAGQAFESAMETRRQQADEDDQSAFESATEGLGAGGAKNPGTGWSPGGLIPDLPTSACQTINVGFFSGHGTTTKQFPTPELCEFIDGKLKPLLAFFLYVLTAGMIVFGAIRSMAPGGGT